MCMPINKPRHYNLACTVDDLAGSIFPISGIDLFYPVPNDPDILIMQNIPLRTKHQCMCQQNVIFHHARPFPKDP